MQTGQKLTLVAASTAIRKALSATPLRVRFFASGSATATFDAAFFDKKEAAPHGQVAEFPVQKFYRHNLVCADSSGWLNFYLASSGNADLDSDLLLLSLKGYDQPEKFNSWLRLTVAGIQAALAFDATFGFWPFSNGPEATTDRWRHGFFNGEHFAEVNIRWFSGGGGGSSQNGNLPTDPTVKTNDFDEKSPFFSLFPNPNQGSFRVERQGFLIEKGQLEIVSSLGQTIRKRSIADGSTSVHVEVGDLPEGIYFVKISSKSQLLKAMKFVKN